jgi:hypothetical protein
MPGIADRDRAVRKLSDLDAAPLGLLSLLLRQAAQTRRSAGMPLLNCNVLLALSISGNGHPCGPGMTKVSGCLHRAA